MSRPRTLPRKNPEDLVRLEPRTSGLRVKHLTTEPRGTRKWQKVYQMVYQIENTVGKGEIARYEQFLIFSSVLERLVLQTCKNHGLFGKVLWSQLPLEFLTIVLKKVIKKIIS